MIDSVIYNVCYVFIFDLIALASVLIISYFVSVLINCIRNGKKHKITNKNIMGFTFRKFNLLFRKNFSQFLKWGLILFIVHLLFVFFDSIISSIQSSVSQENAPLLSLVVDILAPVVEAIKPFITPFIIIVCSTLVIYAISKTVEKCARSEDRSFSKSEKTAMFTHYIQKGAVGFVKFLPKILIILLVCVCLNGIFIGINKIGKIASNYKAIEELNLTVKNLSNSQAFARVTLLEQASKSGKSLITGFVNKNDVEKTYNIEILSGQGDVISSQIVKLNGNEIVIDCININFDYSKIAKGENFNLAYPYRVYSEVVPAVLSTELTCMFNDDNIPVIYCLQNDEIYGLENDVFYGRLKEIFNIIGNEDLSRKVGIRSSIGNAIHFVMTPGDVYDLFVEGTGGISLKKHESLF